MIKKSNDTHTPPLDSIANYTSSLYETPTVEGRSSISYETQSHVTRLLSQFRDSPYAQSIQVHYDAQLGVVKISGGKHAIASFTDMLRTSLSSQQESQLWLDVQYTAQQANNGSWLHDDDTGAATFTLNEQARPSSQISNAPPKNRTQEDAPTTKIISSGAAQLTSDNITIDMEDAEILSSPIQAHTMQASSDQSTSTNQGETVVHMRDATIVSNENDGEENKAVTNRDRDSDVTIDNVVFSDNITPNRDAVVPEVTVTQTPETLPPPQSESLLTSDDAPNAVQETAPSTANNNATNSGGGVVVPVVANNAPDAVDDAVSTTTNQALTINAATSLLANDTDADADTLSITAFDAASANGGTITDNLDGTYRYNPATNFTGNDNFTYTISDGNGGTDTATVNVTVATPALPTLGNLVLHLETNNNSVTNIAGLVSGWQDASGYNNHVTASAGDPRFDTVLTPSGQKAIEFDGADDRLTNVNPLNGLPGGASARTMFFVVDYTSSNTWAGLSYGDDENNQRFSLVVDRSSDDYIMDGWGNPSSYDTGILAEGDGVGNDEFVVQSVTLTGTTLRQYINGVLVKEDSHVYNTDVSAAEGMLDIAGQFSSGAVNGLNTAAALIYDSGLSDTQRLNIEHYLQDTYLKPAGANTLSGTGGDDFLIGVTSDDIIIGSAGNDTIIGNKGADTLTGDAGNDLFTYSYRSDSGTATGNRDIITDFTSGTDKIDMSKYDIFTVASTNGAGSGTADFNATGGAEVAWGRDGANMLIYIDDNGDGTAESEIELTGVTTLNTSDILTIAGITHEGTSAGDTLVADNNANVIATYGGDDSIDARNRDDIVYAGDGNDTIDGGRGDDTIYGGAGNDSIVGARDNDLLVGGAGADTMTGAEGIENDDDIFLYNAFTDTGIGTGNRDVITDFNDGNDRIDISLLTSFTLRSANNTAGNGAADFTSGGSAEVAWGQVAGNTIIYLDWTGDGVANGEIELTGLMTLQNTDFVI